MASVFSVQKIPQRLVFERRLSIQLLQPAILLLKVLHSRELRGLQAAVLRLPLIVGRCAHAVPPANLLDGSARLGLVQDRKYLLLRESGSLHSLS